MLIKYPDTTPDSITFAWGDVNTRIVIPFDAFVASMAFLLSTEQPPEEAAQCLKDFEGTLPVDLQHAIYGNTIFSSDLLLNGLELLNITNLFPLTKGLNDELEDDDKCSNGNSKDGE